MAFEPKVAERLETLLAGKPGMVETRMMGGFGYLCYGNMCAGILNENLIVRLGSEKFEELSNQYDELRIMDITGRAMKNWGMIDGLTCEDECFEHLVAEAERFVRTLPKKEK